MKKDPSDLRNLVIALALSVIIMGCWQLFVEMPRKKVQFEALQAQQKIEQQAEIKKVEAAASIPVLTREEWVSKSPRLRIASDHLHGSVALEGLRFDDLTLAHYRDTPAPNSPDVTLFSPAYDKNGYFSEIGWLPPAGTTITLPNKKSVWTADSDQIVPGKPVTFTWKNPEGATFTAVITLDAKYMFTIVQSAKDAEGKAIPLQTYAYINRLFDLTNHMSIGILHEGPIGVFDNKLKEVAYSELTGSKLQTVETKTGGWIGISDKYWFASLLPGDAQFTSRIFSYISEDGRERYQAEYSSVIPKAETTLRFFAGAKELNVLDAYAKEYNIPLFDRAVDFGMFYWLTKPIFLTLTFFHSLVGNFGVAILLLTIVVKLLMYPLADKSYKAMAQMSIIRPKMLEIQERHKNDKQKLNQEMIELYKREKINPASGCLPVLIQIPVFFSLYKVLYVTLEMRHAPFFGWIHDLSMPDPTNIFTLFGMLQWSPPSLLHLGIWPILMAITMFVQMQQSPPPPDPTQAKIMKWLPVMMLFMFSSVASGLVIYWTWSNTLSILQQWHIKRRYAHLKK